MQFVIKCVCLFITAYRGNPHDEDQCHLVLVAGSSEDIGLTAFTEVK